MMCLWIPFARWPVFTRVPLKCLKTPCCYTLQFGFLDGLVDAHEWIHFHFQPDFFSVSFMLSVLGIFLAEREISLAIKFLG